MAITGNLKDFDISNLIQFNCIEKNTVQVAINWKGYDASLFIKNGEIIHARFRDFKGETALYKILRLDEGEFSITKPKSMPERTIHDSWKSLLLEGMRVMDESQKEKETIVRNIALDLGKHPTIKKLLIVTKAGETIQNSGFDSSERYSAFASAFLEKSKQLASVLTLGDVTYSSYSTDQHNFYFFECDNYIIVIQMGRESDIKALFEIVGVLKSKLLTAECDTKQNEMVSEVIIQTHRA